MAARGILRVNRQHAGERSERPAGGTGWGSSWRLIVVVAPVVVVGVVAVWYQPAHPSIERSADRNVLLVTIDTLRADAPGFAGGRAATPNLDRLAREGVWFDFAHAHAVVTLPSHASILTGLYPFSHGIHDNAGYRLSGELPTLATILQSHGFATGAFVGAFPLDARFGLNVGFDRYDDRYPETNRAGDFVMPERPAVEVIDLAVPWIASQDRPWFAWVHVFDPHSPYQPPPPFDAQYRADLYSGEVAYTDGALGPLFDAVARAPRSTVILVTSDHGEALGEHGEQTHGLFAYEPTLRVPFVLEMPGVDVGRSSVPARSVDVLPTVIDALGLELPAAVPGRSLIKAIEGDGLGGGEESYFEAMTASLNRGWAPLRGVLVGREKYIELPIAELYDLSSDPREERNLLPSRDAAGRMFASRLESLGLMVMSPSRRGESADVFGSLLALGYVSGSAPQKSGYTADDDPKRLVDIDADVQRGIALFQQGDARGALALYETLIARRPSMALAYLHAAHLEWELGDPAGAVRTLEQALPAGAVTQELQVQLGIYLAEAGSRADAVTLLEPVVSGDTGDIDAVNGLGIALARLGRLDEALSTFGRTLSVDPSNASALQNMGTVHLERGDMALAREALEQALELDPGLARALNGLGVVELKTGNRRAAIDAWTRAIEADARQFDTLYNLGIVLLEDGDRTAARRYLERFLKTAPPAFYGEDLDKVRAWLEGS